MTIFKVDKSKEIFGVPVGLLIVDQPIVKEKYVPGSCVNTKAWAEGGVGTAVGLGTVAGLADGGKAGVATAAVVGTVSLVVGGAVAGVSGLYQAFTHQRVTYVTIRNCSNREYSFLSGYNRSGHASVPLNIPSGSIARLAFHNDGPFSGAVRFASKTDFLYIGASNPSIGKNKLRVECTLTEHDLYKYWDDMGFWNTREDCGRNVVLSGCAYDNPSQCSLEIKPLPCDKMGGGF